MNEDESESGESDGVCSLTASVDGTGKKGSTLLFTKKI